MCTHNIMIMPFQKQTNIQNDKATPVPAWRCRITFHSHSGTSLFPYPQRNKPVSACWQLSDGTEAGTITAGRAAQGLADSSASAAQGSEKAEEGEESIQS